MKTASRIAQSIALIVCAPFLWAFYGLVCVVVMLAQTAQSIRKVWR